MNNSSNDSTVRIHPQSSAVSTHLPVLHDPLLNERVLIEVLDGWQVLGPNRRSATYTSAFENCETSLQLLRTIKNDGGEPLTVSILTPSRSTNGKFELLVGNNASQRKCCYRCVTHTLDRLGVKTPDYREWIAYMLLESKSWLNGPAPKERGNV